MANISKITLPNGSVYELKDAFAREQINTIKQTVAGGVQYVGVTTTALSDGATTATVIISKGDTTENHTAAVGDMVDYDNVLYIFNKNSQWDQLGSAGPLKALAYKDSASGKITPKGSVSQPEFTGTKGTATGKITPSGKVAITKGTGVANYTPSGKVTKPTVTVTPDTATVNSITDVGELPSATMPKMTAEVADENLTLSWADGSFDAGSLPTKSANVTVVTGIKSAEASQPTFEGEGVDLEASFTGDEATVNAEFTPAGTVSKPSFTGEEETVTVQ